MLSFKKKKKVLEETPNAQLALEGPSFDAVPEIEEGYNADTKVAVRLVGKRPTKSYQVSGIDDVASKNNWKSWLYLAPVIILVVVFLLYPLINTIYIAFAKNYNYTDGYGTGLTLDNFWVVLGLKNYVSEGGDVGRETNFVNYAIPNTLVITFVTVPLSIFLALIIAVALNSIKWFQKFLQTVFFLPYVTNGIAIGMVFAVIFDQNGIINGIFGTSTAWIQNAEHWTAMIPLCIFIIWNSIPFKILILLSGLQGVDKQYYQAAQIDSASKRKVLMRITVPLLSPQILYLMITGFIGAFKEYNSIISIFGAPSTAGSGGLSTSKNLLTVVYYVYDILEHDAQTKIQYGAAGAVLLFVVILLFTLIQNKASKRRVFY